MPPKFTPIQRARMNRARTTISELLALGNAVFWTTGLLTAAVAFWFFVFRLLGVW